MSDTVRVALAGCGVVGGALTRLLADDALLAGRRVQLVRVLVRDPARDRDAALPDGVLTRDVRDFLATPADVLVEAIGGLETAGAVVHGALAAGRRVVTANKALVAARGPALAALATRTGTRLDFEAAAGGAVPVVRALRDGLAGVGIDGIEGVLNGTSNFVLGRLARGETLDEAIRRAQAAGFAEADPSRDVGGLDAADKLALLAWLAFGIAPHMLPVRVRGLDDAPRLAPAARALGRVVRQVASVARTARGLVASVEPVLVPAPSPLGATRDEENAVVVHSRSAGRIVLSGRGAGGDPTAGALLADLRRPAGPLPEPRIVTVAAADPRAHDWVLVPGDGASADAIRATLAGTGLEVATGDTGVVHATGTVAALEHAVGVAAARGEALVWARVAGEAAR